MKSTLRIALAGLALSFAAHAGAAEPMQSWINSDTRSMETMLGSVVLLQVGTTNTCFICKPQPSPLKRDAGQRVAQADLQQSLKRMRAANAAAPQIQYASVDEFGLALRPATLTGDTDSAGRQWLPN